MIGATDLYESCTTDTVAFTIKALQQAPTGLGTTDTTGYGLSDGTITGLLDDTTYEYSGDNGGSCSSPVRLSTPGSITGLPAGAYLVRFAEEINHAAGATVALVILGERDSVAGTPP